MAYSDRHFHATAEIDMNTDATTVFFGPSQKVQVHKIGICVTTSQTGTDAATFSKVVGTSTATTLAVINVTASSPGKFIYKETAAPLGTLNPGDRISVATVKSGTAPKGIFTVEYSFLDEALGDSNEQATA